VTINDTTQLQRFVNLITLNKAITKLLTALFWNL